MTKLPPCKNSQNFKGKLKEKLKMMAKMRKQLEKEAGTWKKWQENLKLKGNNVSPSGSIKKDKRDYLSRFAHDWMFW